jgi:hypothetical protein
LQENFSNSSIYFLYTLVTVGNSETRNEMAWCVMDEEASVAMKQKFMLAQYHKQTPSARLLRVSRNTTCVMCVMCVTRAKGRKFNASVRMEEVLAAAYEHTAGSSRKLRTSAQHAVISNSTAWRD